MNDNKELLRQCANEALVSLLMPMIHDAIEEAADVVAHSCEVDHSQAKQALETQLVKYATKYSSRLLDMDYLSIWTGYHPAMDYEAPFKPSNDDSDIGNMPNVA